MLSLLLLLFSGGTSARHCHCQVLCMYEMPLVSFGRDVWVWAFSSRAASTWHLWMCAWFSYRRRSFLRSHAAAIECVCIGRTVNSIIMICALSSSSLMVEVYEMLKRNNWAPCQCVRATCDVRVVLRYFCRVKGELFSPWRTKLYDRNWLRVVRHFSERVSRSSIDVAEANFIFMALTYDLITWHRISCTCNSYLTTMQCHG